MKDEITKFVLARCAIQKDLEGIEEIVSAPHELVKEFENSEAIMPKENLIRHYSFLKK